MLFSEIFGNAKWIAASDPEICPVIRRSFTAKDVISAKITILGFGVFECAINGKRIHEEWFLPLSTNYTERDFPTGEKMAHRTLCPVFDVTEFVRDGENVLTVLLGNGWFTGTYAEVPYGGKKLCYLLELTDKNGDVQKIVSDTTAKWAPSFVAYSDLNKGEQQDYTGWEDACLLPEFNDNNWAQTVESEPVESDYFYMDSPTDVVSKLIKPLLLSSDGNTAVYDAGENLSGIPVLRVKEGGPCEITVFVSEELTADGMPDPEYNHRQIFTVKTDGTAREIFLRFTWLGFRYFSVTGPAEVTEVLKIHSDVPVTSDFHCNNEVLNWLFHTYLNTQLCNMHCGIPSDCPHLERRGYTGDGQLTCEAVMTMTDSRKFYDKWLQDISDCQDRLTGHVQYTAPYTHCGGGPGGWGSAIVSVPYVYWKQYGDERWIRELYPQMLRYFDYLEAHSENLLVTSDRAGEWCLGDWCPPGEARIVILPAPFVNNYFYILSLKRVMEIARLTGHEEDIPMLEKRMQERSRATTAAYFNTWDGNFIGGAQGANGYALDIGLGDERTMKKFLEHYQTEPFYDTGIFGTEIVTRLLFRFGENETAYKLMTADEPHGFGHWMKLGATTLWEYWGGRRSHSHPMFGAAATELFRSILGIHQTDDSVGYESVRIAPPLLSELRNAQGYITTVRGKIAVNYHRTDSEITFMIEIPENVSAVLCWQDETYPLTPGTQQITLPITR